MSLKEIYSLCGEIAVPENGEIIFTTDTNEKGYVEIGIIEKRENVNIQKNIYDKDLYNFIKDYDGIIIDEDGKIIAVRNTWDGWFEIDFFYKERKTFVEDF